MKLFNKTCSKIIKRLKNTHNIRHKVFNFGLDYNKQGIEYET